MIKKTSYMSLPYKKFLIHHNRMSTKRDFLFYFIDLSPNQLLTLGKPFIGLNMYLSEFWSLFIIYIINIE